MPAIASTMLSTKKFPVGITHLTLRISNPREPNRGFEHELIVDTGALYSIVPGTLLADIGIDPDRSHTFQLADGRRVQREVGGALYELQGIRAPAPVVFGKRTDAAVLGAVTLEALGFDLDPLRHAIRPIKSMLL
jgi:predicted aspartyl protease